MKFRRVSTGGIQAPVEHGEGQKIEVEYCLEASFRLFGRFAIEADRHVAVLLFAAETGKEAGGVYQIP